MSNWWDKEREKARDLWWRDCTTLDEYAAWNAGWNAARKAVGEPVAKSAEGDLKSVAFREGWKAGYECGSQSEPVNGETPLEERIEAMEDGLAGLDARLVRLTSELSGRIDELGKLADVLKSRGDVANARIERLEDAVEGLRLTRDLMCGQMAEFEEDLATVMNHERGRIERIEKLEEHINVVMDGERRQTGAIERVAVDQGKLLERIEKLEQRAPLVIQTSDVWVQPPSNTGTPTITYGVAGGETKGATDE